ncbi:MAG: type I-E CRISPR-associated protein Cas6/Cse3/CasE [Anaerolineaceae bacterium]|jgi:CRISPR system Cascade subunit CasE|nr:type I-E CRISPR-associated protein Cas6/Cse3/CasE [Anaerolineaceae bacterium]
MYLSNLILNPRNRQVSIDKGNPYELHRSIMLAFPAFNHEKERVLFRLEMGLSNQVLVQSTIIPDWTRLSVGYLMKTPEIKILDISLYLDQLCRFRLRANPSKRDTQSHKRIGLYSEDERLEWLFRKGEQHGFLIQPENVVVSDSPWRQLSIPTSDDGKKHQTTFNFVDFNGLLRVKDPVRLIESLRQGIGPGKGFGCGLLSLART